MTPATTTTTAKSAANFERRKKRPSLLIEPPAEQEVAQDSPHNHYPDCRHHLNLNLNLNNNHHQHNGFDKAEHQQQEARQVCEKSLVNQRIIKKWLQFNRKASFQEEPHESSSTTITRSVIEQQQANTGQRPAHPTFKTKMANSQNDDEEDFHLNLNEMKHKQSHHHHHQNYHHHHHHHHHPQLVARQRQRRRNDLGSYLMILFGSISVLLLASCPPIEMTTTTTTSSTTANNLTNPTTSSFNPLGFNKSIASSTSTSTSTSTTTKATQQVPTTTTKAIQTIDQTSPAVSAANGKQTKGIESATSQSAPPPVESDIVEPTGASADTTSSEDDEQPPTGSESDDKADTSQSPPLVSSAAVTSSSSSSSTLSPTETDDEEADGEDEGPATEEMPPAGKSKLGDLIVDTADSGVDVMLAHLRPTESDEDTTTTDSPKSSNESSGVASPLKSSSTSDSITGESEQQLRFALDTYAKWKATGDDIIELFSRKLLPVIIEHGYDVDTNTVSGLLQVFNGIRGLKPWALKLLDASAKITPGLLVGTQSDFGDFDECLNVRVDDPSGLAADSGFPVEVDEATGLKTSTLVGKYCLADVEFPKPPRVRLTTPMTTTDNSNETRWAPIELRRPLLNFSETAAFKDTIFVETANFFHMLYVDPIRVGICLTNKIDPDSFAQVLNKLVEEFQVTINFRGRCVTKYDRPVWTIQQLASAYVLLGACSLVCLSTLLDLLHTKLNKLPCPRRWHEARLRLGQAALHYRPVFTSFSIIRNTKRLFSTPPSTVQSRPPRRPSFQQQQQQQQMYAHELSKQFNLIGHLSSQAVEMASSGGSHHHHLSSLATTTTTTTTTTGSIPDSSVESSPSIERRSSSVTDANSATDLIIGPLTTTTSSSSGMGTITNSSINSRQKLLPSHASFIAPDLSQQTLKGNSHNYLLVTSSSGSSATSSSSSSSSHHNNTKESVNLLNLHGIRVITMTWMIVNHTYLFGGFFVLWAHRRLIDIAEWPKSMSFQLVLNGWLTVETYFFLSALIIVLNVMPLMRSHKFNYLGYILHRLLRLLPAYLGLVCLNFLWPLISSGPVWLVKGKSFIQTPCENYLWTNFLFINNWIWPEKQCMVHTWFLSADFQLYLLAPLIVYLLYRRPTLGHSVNLLVAIVASILSGFVIYANKLLPTTLINKLEFDSIKQQLSYSYFATYQHMGPYCLGILTGYVLHTRPTIRLPKHLTWLLWLMLPPLSFTTLMLTYLWNGAYDDPDLINPSPLVSALYVAIHRIIWTSLVAWIVFAAATGRAKLLSNFLSHSIFIPLSRLSFSIYLVHLPIIMFRALNLRHTIEWTDGNILWEACGNFVMSLIMGYFLNIAFESPIVNLENAIFGRRTKVSQQPVGERTEASRHNSVFKKLDEQKFTPQSGPSGDLRSASLGGHDESASENWHRKDSANQSDIFQAKSFISSRASENDPNDQKSAENSGHEQNSSMEQETQQSLGDADSQLIPEGSQISTTDKPPTSVPSRRRSLRPSDLQLAHGYRGDEPAANGNSTPPSAHYIERRQRRQMSPYDTRNQQAFLGTKDGDAYNIRAEYQHYAPGAYQQWRISNLSSRPMQYATLARNHRLGQEASHFDGPSEYQPQSHRRDSSVLSDRGHHLVNKPRSYLGEASSYIMPSSRALEVHLDGPNVSNPDSPRRRNRQVLSRGQGRYYTLTGTGSRDWRLRYHPDDDLINHHWPTQLPPTSSANQGQANQVQWLQPGALIPRVDSSTLRRQARRPDKDESRILEEPVGEESSAL